MRLQTLNAMRKLLACYYDEKAQKASAVPFVGSLKDAEIRELWLTVARELPLLLENEK